MSKRADPPIALDVDDVASGEASVGWETAAKLRVLLDEQEQREVLAYNCNAGWVRRNVRTPEGNLAIVGMGEHRRIKSEQVFGSVRVEWQP